jgi:hypothetical protein
MTLDWRRYAACCRRFEERWVVGEVEKVKSRSQPAVSCVPGGLTVNDERRDGTR